MYTYMKLTDGVTEEVMKKAERELGETPEVRKRALEKIRCLIKDEDGFLPVMEDWFLLMFLRSKKFDAKRAFRTLKNYYKLKSTHSGSLTDMRPSQVKKTLEMDGAILSPLRNTNGEAVVIINVDAYDIDIVTAYETLAGGFTTAEIVAINEVTQICGSSFVYDLKGMTLRKLMHFSAPSFVSLIAGCFQDTWPVRVNSVHVINQPPYFNSLWNLAKIWLSKKIKDRVFIHGENLDDLHSSIPRDILPEKMGGLLSNKIYEDFRFNFYKNDSIFDVLTKYTYNGVSYGKANLISDNSS